MKLPGSAPPKSDRISTREELFQVIELLGGFEESQFAELAQKAELLACLETEPDAPSEILEELISNEERLLTEIDSFDSLLAARKAERIN
jgi:hypothetical protein